MNLVHRDDPQFEPPNIPPFLWPSLRIGIQNVGTRCSKSLKSMRFLIICEINTDSDCSAFCDVLNCEESETRSETKYVESTI